MARDTGMSFESHEDGGDGDAAAAKRARVSKRHKAVVAFWALYDRLPEKVDDVRAGLMKEVLPQVIDLLDYFREESNYSMQRHAFEMYAYNFDGELDYRGRRPWTMVRGHLRSFYRALGPDADEYRTRTRDHATAVLAEYFPVQLVPEEIARSAIPDGNPFEETW